MATSSKMYLETMWYDISMLQGSNVFMVAIFRQTRVEVSRFSGCRFLVIYARILAFFKLAHTQQGRLIFSEAKNPARAPYNSTMATQPKEANLLLHGETVSIGNYLIDINYARC